MDCSIPKCYSHDWDSYRCPQGNIPCALTNWANCPPLCHYLQFLFFTLHTPLCTLAHPFIVNSRRKWRHTSVYPHPYRSQPLTHSFPESPYKTTANIITPGQLVAFRRFVTVTLSFTIPPAVTKLKSVKIALVLIFCHLCT